LTALLLLLSGCTEAARFVEDNPLLGRVARLFAPPLEEPAVIWTNRVELADYASVFNVQRTGHTVVVLYRADPAAALGELGANPRNARDGPSLIVGTGLRSL
jgi:hypothetical protein